MRITFALALPTDFESVPVVRRVCRSTLLELGVEEQCTSDIALAVTEACANVVSHAGNGDGFEVQIEVDARRCEIRVVDTGGGFEHAEIPTGDREALAEGGRGIQLMCTLVDELHFAPGEGGTTVTLEKRLELSPDSPLRGLV